MHDHLFLTIFAGVITANILTACLIWGIVTYTKYERQGIAGAPGTHGPFIAVGMILFTVAGAIYVATN